MSVHQRTKIRDAIQALLIDVANPLPWGDRVYTSRSRPLQHNPNPRAGGNNAPYVLIFTRTEASEIVNESPREYRRTVQVEVAVIDANGDDVDDRLDAHAYIVERRIMNADTLGTDVDGKIIADDVRLVSSVLATVDEGEEDIGAVGMTFEVDYYEFLPTEDVADGLDPFNTAHVDYSLGGEQDPADQAQDEFTVQAP